MTVGSEIATPEVHEGPRSSRAVYGVLLISAALLAASGWLLSTTALNVSARQGPWWIGIAILVGFGLAERFAFHMEYRRETMSFTLSEVPAAFALVFLGPAGPAGPAGLAGRSGRSRPAGPGPRKAVKVPWPPTPGWNICQPKQGYCPSISL